MKLLNPSISIKINPEYNHMLIENSEKFSIDKLFKLTGCINNTID